MDHQSHSRKRSSAWIDQDTHENVSYAYTPVNLTDLPSKRLQNPHGAAVHARPPLKYDAQRLLSNLAFTRFYVTANFQNFDPRTSCVVLCMVSEQNAVYRALCHVLPTLYPHCPALQGLAVTSGYLNPNATSDQTLQRLLPLVTTACVDATVVEEFERFRRDVGGPEGCIAVISPEGTCLWSSSAELGGAALATEDGVEALRAGILGALPEAGVGRGGDGDLAMGDG